MTVQCFLSTGQSCPNVNEIFTRDETGQPLTMIDSNSKSTKYSYADSYTSGTPPGNTNAYLTEITFPQTSVIGTSGSQQESFSYGFADGQLTAFVDKNQQQTSYKYADVFDRLTETDYPDGGKSQVTYNDSPGSLSVETRQLIDTRWTDDFVLFDGFGHDIGHSRANGESTPWDKVDTCYDGEELKLFVSYPYQTSSYNSAQNCSGSGDGFSYDTLGRLTSITHSDATASTFTYKGRATETSDEGNGSSPVQHIYQRDALGRLLTVCEITSGHLLGQQQPAVCNLDISSNSGLETNYQYDPLGNMLQSYSSGSQPKLNVRAYSYDSISRLITSSQPESGTTCYGQWSGATCLSGYDGNGNLLLRTRPAPNQPWGSQATVTTTYSYDSLNRRTKIHYNDGSTPDVTFQYDQISSNGKSLQNYIGKLTTASAANGTTQSVFSYDKVGRIADEWVEVPGNSSLFEPPLQLQSHGVGVVVRG